MALPSCSLQRDKFLCNVKTPRRTIKKKKKKKKNIHLKVKYSKSTLYIYIYIYIHGIEQIFNNFYITQDGIIQYTLAHIFLSFEVSLIWICNCSIFVSKATDKHSIPANRTGNCKRSWYSNSFNPLRCWTSTPLTLASLRSCVWWTTSFWR